MMPFLSLEHIPPRFHNSAPAQLPPPIDENLPAPVQVWYDENWEEIPSGPGNFYRTGVRDSLGRWQGKVKDFYANGDVQMKGAFQDDRRDGIFIYYSDHHTYEAAGRYREDRRIGKWENYYRNGHLESEEYYQDRYFLKNYWDSTGVQLVKDGFGHVVKRFANGVVREEGSYRDGRQQDLWMGRHPDGQVCFEEYYLNGRLTKGRSRNVDGKYFVYDESSFFPTPAGGWKQLAAYITQAAAKLNARSDGRVRLSFRVTLQGKLTDIKVEKSLSGELDEKAKEILLKGPRWIPAHTHGFQVTDGIAFVNIDFEKSR
jgi:TonB family protein